MTDVLIIGGGLAGWRAAEAAVARGCSVTLVANGVGNSPDVHALNCPVRAEDSVERYFTDTMSSGRAANDPALVRVMCERSLELKDEYAFGPDVIQPVGSTVPRCVSIDHAIGAIALRRIKDGLRDKVQVIDGTVTDVSLVDRDFRVQISACRDASVTARSLIIATGGWCGKYDFTTNPTYLKGDGIRFAEALGGAVRDVDEEHVQYEPTVRVDGSRRGVPVITTLLHEGATLRNAQGEEFLADKCANKDVIAKAIFREIAEGRGEPGALPVTDASRVAPVRVAPIAPCVGVWYDLTGCSEDSIRRCKMNLGERMILVAPAAHSSLGGVVIDAKCRVTAAQGATRDASVTGLFACGEVTAGVHGLNRLGGNGGTAAMVFGRIAGESAAEYVKSLLKTDDL